MNKIDYLKPEYVYLPFTSFNKEYKNKYIYKGELIGNYNGINVYSSVSGYIKGMQEHLNINNKKIKYLKIKNDYKEKINKEEVLNNIYYNKKSLINTIIKNNIINYELKNIDMLIINLLPYQIDKYTYEKIINIIDDISTLLEVPLYILTSKKIKNNYIKTYPNINIIYTDKKYYDDNILLRKIFNTKKEKTLFLNVNQLISINSILKYNFPSMEKTIIIKDNQKEILANVKIGTLLSEVLDKINYQNNDNNLLIVGTLLKGTSLSSDDLVISREVDYINIIKNNLKKENPCIRCGKCVLVCPYGLSPVEIRNNVLNNKKINIKNIEKCTECGLCSYHCPAKIELVEYIKKEKENIYEKV